MSATVGFTTGLMMVGGAFVSSASAGVNEDLQAQIASLLAMIASLQAQLEGSTSGGSTSSSCTPYTFTRSLTVGDTGADVMQLQKIFNGDAATQIASSGVGSPSQETEYFGGLTKSAAIKWQDKHAAEVLNPIGLFAGTGFIGSMSLAKLNADSVCDVVEDDDADDDADDDVADDDDDVVATGDDALMVELAPQPAFSVIASNASSETFGEFIFTAGDEDVEIDGLTVARTGLGDKDDFDDVWITVDGVKFGNEKSITTGDKAVFTFGTPLMIDANESVDLAILASLAGSPVGHYNALGLSEIDANVEVDADLPLWGPQTTVANQAATEITLTTQGSDKTVSVGNLQTEIGRFQIDVNSTNDQDVTIDSITFENQGTVSDLSEVLANVVLTQGGVDVSTGISFNAADDTITFSLDGYEMDDGQTQSFIVRADIISAEVGDTIILELDDDSDFVAREAGSGAGVRIIGDDNIVSGGASNIDPANNVTLRTYTVETGDINLSINDAASRNAAPGMDDVVLIDGILVVDSAFEADGLKVRLGSGTSVTGTSTRAKLEANFENVTLRIDGVTVDIVDTLTAGTNGVLGTGATGDYFDFDASFEVGSGTHTITVEMDVQNAAVASDSIELIIYSGDFESAEYVFTGDNVPTGELTGQADGSVVTVQASVVTLTRNDGFSGETIIGGVKDVPFMRFTIDANDSSDVFISSVTFAHYLPASTTVYQSSDVTNLTLFIDGVQKGSPVDLTSGSITDANFTVGASQQVQAELRFDTNTTATAKTLGINLSNTTVDATDEQGNDATVTGSLTSDVMTIGTAGTLSVTTDGNSPDEDILVGDTGATWYPVLTYRLTAEDEDVLLTDLFLKNAPVSGDFTVSAGTDARVMTLGLFDEDGTLKQSKTLSNGTVRFDLGEGSSAITIPADDFTRVTVKVKLNNINDADKSGKVLRLALWNASGVTNAEKGLIAQSTSVGSDLAAASISTTTDATSTASDFFSLRNTKPTITVPTQPFTTLVDGTNKVIYKFTVSADGNEDVSWKGTKLDVVGKFGGVAINGATSTTSLTAGGAGAITNAQLFETSNGQEVQNGDYTVEYGWDGSNGEIAFIINDGNEEVVSAGSSKTYELRVTLAGVDTSGDFVDVSFDNEADDAKAATVTTFPDNVDGADGSAITMVSGATVPFSFLWSDNSGSPHSLANATAGADSDDWTNDRFVEIDNASWNITSSI